MKLLKPWLLGIGWLMLACSAAGAQQWAQEMFEVKKHDFGSVPRGAKAEYRFEIYNPFVEDVHIAGASSSCGCTSVKVEKSTLKTYETGSILAHLNSDRFLGKKGATITVRIDKPYPAQVRLQVKSYIRSDVVFEPGSVELGTVNLGEKKQQTVDVEYAGRSDWKITDLKTNNPHLHAEILDENRHQGRVRYRLMVELDPDAPVGYLHDRIVLQTNDYQNREVPLLVEGVVKSSIVVSPASLFLGKVDGGEEVVKKIVIRGDAPFRIKKIICDSSTFHFDFDPTENTEPRSLYIIPVRFKSNHPEANQRITEVIRIETDQGTTMPELPVYAEVSPANHELQSSSPENATTGS
jgi:hypothetical protein